MTSRADLYRQAFAEDIAKTERIMKLKAENEELKEIQAKWQMALQAILFQASTIEHAERIATNALKLISVPFTTKEDSDGNRDNRN